VDPDDVQPAPEADSNSDEEPILRSTRVRRALVAFQPQARQTSCNQYNHDQSFHTARDALINTKVRIFFPGCGTLNGIITWYYSIKGTYHRLLEDGDEETDSYDNIQK
jgi:hypothetical protein